LCGFVGFVNYKQDISKQKNILVKMNHSLSQNGSSKENYYIRKHIAFVQFEKEENISPVPFLNGQIYNKNELRKTLEENGFTFKGNSDTEILQKAYIHYGKNIVNHLNGIFAFAIWDDKNEELFIARDHLGVKPLFYTMQNNSFILSSEIKALFKYPGVQKILTTQGISELLGIGPAHTPGTTIFDNIFELKPAHFAVFNRSGLHFEKYWCLKSRPHTETLTQTCEHLEFL